MQNDTKIITHQPVHVRKLIKNELKFSFKVHGQQILASVLVAYQKSPSAAVRYT